MPKGEDFSIELKQVFFRVIEFVESERNGLTIGLTSTTARIIALLGISEHSVKNLRSELVELKKEKEEESSEETKPQEPTTPARVRTRSAATVSISTGRRKVKRTWSARQVAASSPTLNVPTPIPPQKKGKCGRRRVKLSEEADNVIRYHFHLILNSKHFLELISRSASQLRQKHSKDERIALIIDNATWHNVLTVESSPPKRAWPKAKLHQWLKDHDIPFDQRMKNSELRDIAFSHVPRKEYLTNIAASEFDVEIIRLPIKHCCFNPIELCWAQLKGHVRRHNTSFRLSDIQRLSNEYIDSLSDCSQYIEHAKKAEDVFKLGDNFVEETIDPELVDEDEEEEDPFWINSNDEEDS
ncbi:unnamed protein product [Didymodactylos carnosus]|uniref:Uncharacterized protein n=1 Tax=Didymodactylos carnosus TaxID=1234261 RepID=A0A8S2D2J6_9BILA|nr:unnamed protein product [Didymodactylos carnosus]CAF3610934.1 unnamed protein product [Didymodactylos carnosus]